MNSLRDKVKTRKNWKSTLLALHQLEPRNCPTAGLLDPDFSGDGITTIDFGAGATVADWGLVLQPDGKIIMAGTVIATSSKSSVTRDFAVARLNGDGSLDTSFGVGGLVKTNMSAGSKNAQTNDSAVAAAIQPDGKIVVAGNADGEIALARYNSNGSLDASFDGDGKVVTTGVGSIDLRNGSGLQILTDGKILIGSGCRVGTSKTGYQYGIALVRYNANGSLDTTFDGDGVAVSNLNSTSASFGSMEIQSDGRIVARAQIAGVHSYLRWNSNGSPDLSFGGGDGKADLPPTAAIPGDLELHADSIYVVARQSADADGHPLIARYTSDGVLDPSFGDNGVVVETAITFGHYRAGFEGIKVLDDGRIVVAGGVDRPGQDVDSSDTFIAARYLADGELDTTFNGGIVYSDVSTASGLEIATDLAIQDDGKIVTAGFANYTSSGTQGVFAVARYLGDDPVPFNLISGPTLINNPPIAPPSPWNFATCELLDTSFNPNPFDDLAANFGSAVP